MTHIRIKLDNRPGAIVDWTIEGRSTFADINLDTGEKTFCRWPSPRIQIEDEPPQLQRVIKMTDDDEIKSKLRAALDAGISEDTMKAIHKKAEDVWCMIEDDIMYRLKDDLAPNLVSFVCDMAKRTVEAILAGNEDQMRRYLGCERGHWNGRSDGDQGYGRKREDHEWHPIIHGKLFEQGAVELRKQMANAHADLIKNERILDLEDQVKSLTAQYNKAKAERETMWERCRGYLQE